MFVVYCKGLGLHFWLTGWPIIGWSNFNRTTTDTNPERYSKYVKIQARNIKIYQTSRYIKIDNSGMGQDQVLPYSEELSSNKHPQKPSYFWVTIRVPTIPGDSPGVIAFRHRLSRSTSLWRSRCRVSSCSASSLDPVHWNPHYSLII